MALFSAFPVCAFAQQAPSQSPHDQALAQKLSEEINQEMAFRESVLVERAKNVELQKQIDDLKPKVEAPK